MYYYMIKRTLYEEQNSIITKTFFTKQKASLFQEALTSYLYSDIRL